MSDKKRKASLRPLGAAEDNPYADTKPEKKNRSVENATKAAGGPILHLFEPCSTLELMGDHESEHWTDAEGDPLADNKKQHIGMDAAPPKVRKLAQSILDALNGAELPAGELAGPNPGIVIAISNVNVAGKDSAQVLEACLGALGIKEEVHGLATVEELHLQKKLDVGFCCDDTEDDPNDDIKKATVIMADSLDSSFVFDFDPDEIPCAPMIWGGIYENCVVGVLGMRVFT